MGDSLFEEIANEDLSWSDDESQSYVIGGLNTQQFSADTSQPSQSADPFKDVGLAQSFAPVFRPASKLGSDPQSHACDDSTDASFSVSDEALAKARALFGDDSANEDSLGDLSLGGFQSAASLSSKKKNVVDFESTSKATEFKSPAANERKSSFNATEFKSPTVKTPAPNAQKQSPQRSPLPANSFQTPRVRRPLETVTNTVQSLSVPKTPASKPSSVWKTPASKPSSMCKTPASKPSSMCKTPAVTSSKTPLSTQNATPLSDTQKTPARRILDLSPYTHAQISKRARHDFKSPFSSTPFSSTPKEPTAQRAPERPVKRKSTSNPDENKISLRDWGFRPGHYSKQDLLNAGIEISAIEMTYERALRFEFGPCQTAQTARADLCKKLHDRPVTEKWVRRHWPLIVWKLAGYACSKPSESALWWSYDTCLAQLAFRYVKEHFELFRSPLRTLRRECEDLMYADCHATPRAMAVCLILATEPVIQRNNECIAHVTDGWSTALAKFDAPLARAMQRSSHPLRPGAKLLVLQPAMTFSYADDDVMLNLHSNSTRLEQWDARLGWRPLSRVAPASLKAMSCDGGLVTNLLARVEKIFPVGYRHATWAKRRLGDQDRGPQAERDVDVPLWDQVEERRRQIEHQEAFEKAIDAVSIQETRFLERLESHIKDAVIVDGEDTSFSLLVDLEEDRFPSLHMSHDTLKALKDHLDTYRATYSSRVHDRASSMVPERNVSSFCDIRLALGDDQAFLTIWDVDSRPLPLVEGKLHLISGIAPYKTWNHNDEFKRFSSKARTFVSRIVD